MATLCTQDKIAKINAELARLELEMELDHVEGGSYAVSSYLDPRKWFKSSEKKEKTEDATGPHYAVFTALIKAVFEKIASMFSADRIESSCNYIVDVGSVLKKFKENTGKADTGHLQVWECSVGGRAFYVLMRVVGGASQYSIIRAQPEIMKQKDFGMLEYSPGVASDETTLRFFIERIARAVCTGDDLVKILKK